MKTMKSFIRQLISFIAFISIANAALLVGIIILNQQAVNNCDIDDSVDTLIIGDSHPMWSIDTSNFETIKNISLSAEGYIYTYYKLKHLLNHESHISHIYLGFSYHNLSGYYDHYISGIEFKHFIHQYLGVMNTNDFIQVFKNNPLDIFQISKNILQRGARSGLKMQCTLYGTFPESKKLEQYNTTQMQQRIQWQYYDNGQLRNPSESNIRYLDKIINLIKEKNIKLTIISTPLHQQYFELIPGEYKRIYQNYIRNNQLDLYNFNDLNLPDSYFLPDADHINYHGAVLTTAKFREYHENRQK